MGVMFLQPKSYVTAFGIILKLFFDGSWFDETVASAIGQEPRLALEP
jgi:predicted SpoU family rRNA methylase